MDELKEFIAISKLLGDDLSFVQAGGGNTSQKIDDYKMAVKSSGSYLRDISAEKGFCIVDFKNIQKYHDFPASTEDQYSQDINDFVEHGDSRPSMESGFHALIPKTYVLHSHPVYLNVLLCSQEGEAIISEMYPDSIFIKSIAPGKKLSMKINSILQHMQEKESYTFFLQNHGLITASDDLLDCLKLHKSIALNVKERLSLPKFLIEENKKINPILSNKILFPDQIVFLNVDDKESDGFVENFAAANYIYSQILSAQLTPIFLDPKLVQYIESMDSEKYRQKLKQK